MPVSTSRPESPPCISAKPSAIGTVSEFGCRIDSLWMSSISNACPAVLLASTAWDHDVRSPLPQIDTFPLPPSAITISCTIRVQGSVAPCRHTPRPSSRHSFACCTTSFGICSKLSPAAKPARSRVAFACSGAASVVMLVSSV